MVPPILKLPLPLFHHFGMDIVVDSRPAGHGDPSGFGFDPEALRALVSIRSAADGKSLSLCVSDLLGQAMGE